MFKEIISFAGSVLAVLLVLTMVVARIFALAFYFDRIACINKYADAQYKAFGGCMVMYEGRYVPEDLYKQAFVQNINLQIKK